MADFLPSTFGQNFQQGWEQAQQRRDKNKLSQLYQQAYTAPEEQRSSILAQVAGMDPQAAESLEKRFNAQNEQHRKELVETARALTSAPEAYRPHVYQQLRQKLGGNFYGQPLPPEYGPDVAQAAEAILKSYGGSTTGDELKSLRVGANGNYWAIRGGEFVDTGTPAAQNLRPIDTGAGYYGFDPRTGGAAPVMIGGGQQQGHPPTASQGGSPYASLPPGLRITSGYRSPEENARLPNSVPNSFHTRAYADGSPQAIDVGTPTPEQQQEITQWANQNDYEVIRNYADGHWHLEPRGSQQGGGQQLSKVSPQVTPYQQEQLAMQRERMRVAQEARDQAAAARKAADEAKLAAKAQAASARQAQAAETANGLVTAIDSLEEHPGFGSLGTVMGDARIATPLFRNDAKDADAQLKNIAGQVALATMDRLKALSAQGATGFGALSQNELTLLQNSIATLQRDEVSNKQLKESLRIIREKMQKVSGWRAPAESAQQTNDARRKALLDKY